MERAKDVAIAAGKTIAVGLGAAATAFGALSIKALQMGGDLEQSLGGIETLFKDSADIVIDNAKKAYLTAGVDANNYMQQVTSFSASLLQSLGGDTEAAAKAADMAIIDMADNANKMGSNIGDIQNAYQGFAKQNFDMLDNLKLGYAGTKEGMEKLLADAEKLSGTKYDISNLNDIYQAIHVIQEEMGIAGTTAKEGMETFSGALVTAQAALSNFLSGAGGVDAVTDSVTNFVNIVIKNLDELLPRLSSGLIEIMNVLGPQIPEIIGKLLPSITQGAVALVTGLINGITSNLPMLVDAGGQIISALLEGVGDVIPILTPITNALQYLTDNLNTVATALTPLIVAFIAFQAVMMIAGIINGVTIAMTAATAVMELYAAGASMATVAQAGLGAGATIFGTIMAVATGKITLATVAHRLWNVTMAANPIGLVIAGVAALVAGIVLLVHHTQKITDEQAAMAEKTKELAAANKDLVESINDSSAAFDNKMQSIDAEANKTQNLADKITALAEKENKSAAEKQQLATYVDTLNTSMEDLNVQYDAENDALTGMPENISAVIEAKKELAESSALQERATELAKEQLELEEKANEISMQRIELEKTKSDNMTVMSQEWHKYNESLRALNAAEEENARQLEETSSAYEFVTGKMTEYYSKQEEIATDANEIQAKIAKQREESDNRLTEKMIENANALGLTLDEYKDQLEDVRKKQEEYTEAATNMFDSISTKSDVSISEMIRNLQHNRTAMEEWRTNLATIAQELGQDFANEMESLGKAGVGAVAEIVKAPKEQREALAAEWRLSAQSGGDAYNEGMVEAKISETGANELDAAAKAVVANTSFSNSMMQQISDAKTSMESQVTLSNFPGIGLQVVSGIISGINSGKSVLNAAIKNMVLGMRDTAEKTAIIQSPSKLFERDIGAKIAEGTAVGIDKNTDKATKATEKMMKEVYGTAKLMIDDYRNDTEYLASEEMKMWEALTPFYAAGTKERVEIDKNAAKLREQIRKEDFEHSKNWIENKKFFGLLSLEEEIKAWERVQARYLEGTKEREEADKALYTARQNLIKEEEKRQQELIDLTESTFKSFVSNIDSAKVLEDSKAAYDTATEKVSKLQDELAKLAKEREKEEKSLEKEKLALNELAGSHDEYAEKQEKIRESTEKLNETNENYISKQKELTEATKEAANAKIEASKSEKQIMMESLNEQVDSMKEWAGSLESLTKRGIDEGLLKQLTAMGPSAQANMQALNSMTETELTAYQDKWKEGYEIAGKYALAELGGIRIDTGAEIKGLGTDLEALSQSSFGPAGEANINSYIDRIQAKYGDVQKVVDKIADIVDGVFNKTSKTSASQADIQIISKETQKSTSDAADNIIVETEDLISDSDSLLTKLKDMWANTFIQINATINNRMKIIKQEMFSFMTNMITELDRKLRELAQVAGVNMMTSFKKGIDSMKSNISDLMSSVGVLIVDGLIAGIEKKEPDLLRKIDDLVAEIKRRLDDYLEIASPSKYTTRLGEFLGEGLAIGMDNSLSDIYAANRRMADAALISDVDIPHIGQTVTTARDSAASGAAAATGDFIVNQFIETVPQTPHELESAAVSYFTRARWGMKAR